MIKLAKRITLVLCAFVFATLLGAMTALFSVDETVVKADTPTVTFVGVGKEDDSTAQNNDLWEQAGYCDWTVVYLRFSDAFTEATNIPTEEIYYTVPDSDTPVHFSAYWITAPAGNKTIMCLSPGTPQELGIPEGSVLHIIGGTAYQGQVLPEVTLYMNNGNWSSENSKTTVEFVRVGKENDFTSQNNDPWEEVGYGDWQATYLTFSGGFTEATELFASRGGIYYTLPDGATRVAFTALRVTASVGVNTLILLNEKSVTVPDGAILRIEHETEIGGQILSELTLYMVEQNWTTAPPIATPKANLVSVGEQSNNGSQYLFNLNFDRALSSTGIAVVAWGNYLKVNGTALDTNAAASSTAANSAAFTTIIVNAAIPTLSASVPQVALELTDAVAYGDVILQPFTLYLNGENQWQLEPYTYLPPVEASAISASLVLDTGTAWYVNVTFNRNLASAPMGLTVSGGSFTANGERIADMNAVGYSIPEGALDTLQIFVSKYSWQNGVILSESNPQVKLSLSTALDLGDNVIAQPFDVYWTETGAWQIEPFFFVANKVLAFVDVVWNEGESDSFPGNNLLIRYTDTVLGADGNENVDITAQMGAHITLNGVPLGEIEDAKVYALGAAINGAPFILIGGYDAYRTTGTVLQINAVEVRALRASFPALTLTFVEGKSWCYDVTYEIDGNPYHDYVTAGANESVNVAEKIIEAGAIAFSYRADERIYDFTTPYAVTGNATVTVNSCGFYTVEGCSVRISKDGHNGLRFETRFDYADYNALVATYGKDAVRLGTYIFPAEYLTLSGKASVKEYIADYAGKEGYYVDVSTWNESENENGFINDGENGTAKTDGYYKYYGTISDINPENYAVSFIGVGYATVTVDGTTYIFLTHDGSWSRSVYYVAKAAYMDTANVEESSLPYLTAYLDKIVAINDVNGEPTADCEVINAKRAYTPAYTLEYENGVYKIVASAGLYDVIINGERLGAMRGTKYVDCYATRLSLEDSPPATFRCGFSEPTKALCAMVTAFDAYAVGGIKRRRG